MEISEFLGRLASGDPVPGGGGASALTGGIGAALCAMVAKLTAANRRYEAVRVDMEEILRRADASVQKLTVLIQKDAQAFTPLAAAYRLPKDAPGREETLESALLGASAVPLELMGELADIAGVLEILAEKGAKLALSDVGVAAAMLRAALEGAALNVFINTKLMKNRARAQAENERVQALISDVVPLCEGIYARVRESLAVI